jgi:predicted O-methyltransferase YrrM
MDIVRKIMTITEILNELEAFGQANDAATTDRTRRMLNITRDTGEFLALLVRAMGARRILEVGTSNGYSTLWLAQAAQTLDGFVTTVEQSPYKIDLATKNFARAGLAPHIQLVPADAGVFINQPALDEFDLVFLDSERTEYTGWWPRVRTLLRVGGLLVADNATSHAQEMQSFMSMVKADKAFITSLVPVGNGEFLALKVAL